MTINKHLKPITPLLLTLLVASPATQSSEISDPFPGVHYVHEIRQNPSVSLHILTIDLTNPSISLHVSPGGPAPDPKWQTTLLSVPKIAERDHLDIAINTDYFAAETSDSDGLNALINRGYRTGQRANVMGSAVTDGTQWATGSTPKPALLIGADGKISTAEITHAPPGVAQAITGNFYLTGEGRPGGHRGTERTARTAVAWDKDGKTLYLFVADGLFQGKASGISIPDLVQEMMKLNCWYSINLDGGGSTTIVMRNSDGKYQVLNRPTDGKPRAVAEVLGVRVKSEK